MNRQPLLASICLLITVLFGCSAYADIPVIDNSNLDQHSATQSHTNKTKQTQAGTTGNTKGVDCSVHQGGKNADAKDGSTEPNQDGARQGLQHYGGDPLGGGDATGQADAAARGQTGQIAAQQEATASDVQTGELALHGLAQKIGTTQTLKGAFDQNSVMALQAGLEINGVIRIANSWVQAINLTNILNAQQQSTAATATSSPTALHCTAGTVGQGTSAQPCRSRSCETVQLGQTADPGCIEVKYHDSYDNVVTYLVTIEDAGNFKTQGLVLN